MSKWNLPATGGHMEKQDGIYYQNMTTKMVEERLKTNDVLLLPVGSTENPLANVSTVPEAIPGLAAGKTTFRKMVISDIPRVLPA